MAACRAVSAAAIAALRLGTGSTLQIANAVGAVRPHACWLRLTSALQSLVRAVFVRATPGEPLELALCTVY
eukprot:7210262-Prymnesium_polylepis.1